MEQFYRILSIQRRIAIHIALFSALCLGSLFFTEAAEKPGLPLANIYHEGVDLNQYWISEKLDGVRAYWNGSHFISRNGNSFSPPAWFTAGFPSVPLDGELWMGRGAFQQVVGVVKKQQPDDQQWRKVRYMVFDLASDSGGFTQRLERLRALIRYVESPYLQLVNQYRVTAHTELMKHLERVVDAGGEGLMLHHGAALYRAGRSDDLLKLKPYLDAEARVIAHLPGKGKYTGVLGALLVERPDGQRFRIGTGFSDAERKEPPAVGTHVTYQYHGFTDRGLPRFPSYLRVREER